MPFLEGVSGPVYYRHWAVPEPRVALVFLHGFGEHSGLYHRYAFHLGLHGIDVWALDEVGHGLTAGERGNVGPFDDLVTNAVRLTDVARAAAPDLPLVVGGHSLGSLVALLAALDHPATYVGAVVSGAPLSPLPWLQDVDGPLDLDPEALSADPFYLDQLENDPLAFTSADVAAILAAAFPPVWDRFATDLPTLAVPLLAVHGEKDTIAPLDGVTAWRDRLPGLQLEVLEGAGHDVLNEVAHRRVADRVAAFVRERAGERS